MHFHMNIIPNNYENVLKEMIFSQFSNNLKKELDSLNSNNVFNYINLLSNLDESLCEIAKNSLVTIFETIDKSYCNSIERKRKYHIRPLPDFIIDTVCSTDYKDHVGITLHHPRLNFTCKFNRRKS